MQLFIITRHSNKNSTNYRCNIIRLISIEKETIGRRRKKEKKKKKRKTVVRNVKPMIRVQDNPERIESTEEKTGPRLEGDKTGQA